MKNLQIGQVRLIEQYAIQNTMYRKRVDVQKKSNILLKTVLLNTQTFQQIKFNQMKLYTKIIKGPA